LNALAIIRPDDWNLAIFFHVLGAMVATGGLVLALAYLSLAWRGDSLAQFRAGYKALLWAAIPGFIVMRVAAQWIYSEQNWDAVDPPPSWIDIGFIVGDAGLLFLLIATITAGVSTRRGGAGTAAVRVTTSLTALLLVAYVVSVWAMTAKPI